MFEQLHSPWTGSKYSTYADATISTSLQCNQAAFDEATALKSPLEYANRLLMASTCSNWEAKTRPALLKTLSELPKMYNDSAQQFSLASSSLVATCYNVNFTKGLCDELKGRMPSNISHADMSSLMATCYNVNFNKGLCDELRGRMLSTQDALKLVPVQGVFDAGNASLAAMEFIDRNCYALDVSNQVINYSLWKDRLDKGPLKNASTLAKTCKAVAPNELTFAGTQNFTVDIWTYPADANAPVNVAWCVGFFFFLSFIFQLMAMCCGGREGGIFKLGYYYLFPDDMYQSGDEHHVKIVRTPDATLTVTNKQSGASEKKLLPVDEIVKHVNLELRFNWLRFVEYSASGSLVLFTIAVLAGVTDINLLVCMFFLSATCMLLGIVAEIALRIRNALKMFWVVPERVTSIQDAEALIRIAKASLQQSQKYTPDNKQEVTGLTSTDRGKIEKALGDYAQLLEKSRDTLKFKDSIEAIRSMLKVGFRLSHLLGWVCIAVPWVMVGMQLGRWYEPCDAESLVPSPSLFRLLGIEVTNTPSSQVSSLFFVFITLYTRVE